jgi:hypothetical protein
VLKENTVLILEFLNWKVKGRYRHLPYGNHKRSVWPNHNHWEQQVIACLMCPGDVRVQPPLYITSPWTKATPYSTFTL